MCPKLMKLNLKEKSFSVTRHHEGAKLSVVEEGRYRESEVDVWWRGAELCSLEVVMGREVGNVEEWWMSRGGMVDE